MPGPAFSILSAVFAALPFLPRGKGALILMLGGMLVLTFSLLWSFVTPRRQGAQGLQTGTRVIPNVLPGEFLRPPGAPARDRVRFDAGTYWIRSVLSTAARAGLGRPELVQSGPGRHVIRLSNCRSCHERRRGAGCEEERGTLEQVMQTFAPRGRVVELSCSVGTPIACTFELRPGVPAA